MCLNSCALHLLHASSRSPHRACLLPCACVLLPGCQITINRPERRNAFRPETVKELQRAFAAARDDPAVGVIIFTGKVGDPERGSLC